MGAKLLVETLVELELQAIQPIPQDASEATYASLIKKENYCIDWSRSALELHNQIRGFFPNCIATFRDKEMKIAATAPLGPEYWPQLPPELSVLEQDWSALSSRSSQVGEIASIAKGIGPIVQTGEGLLLLQQVQLSGKRAQTGWDFANGTRLAVGEILANGR